MSSVQPRNDELPNLSPHMVEDAMSVMRSQIMGTSLPATSQGCMETQWRGLPARKLFVAAHQGNVKDLRDLLKQAKWRKMANDLDNDQCGILHVCALSGQVHDSFDVARDIVQLLVEAGMNINNTSPAAKETALQMATIYGNVEYVKALLDNGARCDITDWKGSAPIPTARSKCKHDGTSNQKCCEVLKLLLKAQEMMKLDKGLQEEAERLRNAGNKSFGKRKYEEAREFYTQSIHILEDHRAFANRSLCSIKIAQKKLQKLSLLDYPVELRRWGKEIIIDAGKASTLNSTFVKAYYRKAIGQAFTRDLPRAKLCIRDGLKVCPGNKQLMDLLQQLEDLNVPDHINNPYASEEYKDQLRNGADYLVCCYCMVRNPLPIQKLCTMCSMPFEEYEPEIEQSMRLFMLNN